MVGYRKSDMSDFQVLIKNAEENAKVCGIDLYGSGYYGIIPKKSSVILCKALRNEINRISRQNNVKKHKDFEEEEERE